jgi:hypothetical protein
VRKVVHYSAFLLFQHFGFTGENEESDRPKKGTKDPNQNNGPKN